MDLNKFTTKAAGAVEGALSLVTTHGQQSIEPAHLLAALLSTDSGIVLPLLKKLGKDTATLLRETEKLIASFPRVSGAGEPYIGSALREVFVRADKEAKRLQDQYVSTEHLFLALIEDATLARVIGVARADAERERGADELVEVHRGAVGRDDAARLRPHQRPEELAYPGDDAPDTVPEPATPGIA